MHLVHPLLRPGTVEDREYQRVLAERLISSPHLLVLPTGLGKTVVALRVILHYLAAQPDRRVLLLSPTKPLCDQHGAFFTSVLEGVAVSVFTGETSPGVRDEAWLKSRLIVATPQVVQNDLIRGTRDLRDVGLIIYDEAHRATGNYPYVFIAKRYRAVGGQAAAGLTASPGNDGTALQRVLHNLNLDRVEVRSDRDPDVAPYVKDVAVDWVRVRPTQAAQKVTRLLERMYIRTIAGMRRLGYLPNLRGLPSRKDLILLGQRQRADLRDGVGGRSTYEAVSLQARALKLQHALEVAETQGTAQAASFLARLEEEATSLGGSKAARDLVGEPEFAEALRLCREDPEPPPKVVRILELVRNGLAAGQRRVLVFANFRETADTIVASLSTAPEVNVSRFVGHSKSGGEKGQSKKEQQETVKRFREGTLNVLVATSVGEEGLDLPETDAVILHEPVASAIRFVQRRGRTGRRSDGRLYVLMTEGTRDELYHWNALRRERQMHETLNALKRLQPPPRPAPPTPAPTSPSPLTMPSDGAFQITVDPRESGSELAKTLLERGIQMRTSTLPTGDFAIGERVLVERKSASDFIASLKDGRLFDQLPRLAQAGVGILLLEGDPYREAGGVAPQAITGAIAAAALDHRVSIVFLPNPQAAADFLVSLSRRAHRAGERGALRLGRSPRTPDDQARYILEGLPQVGPRLADNLLARFGSVAAVAAASPEELAETPGIGADTAKRLHSLLHRTVVDESSTGLGRQVDLGTVAPQAGDAAARG